jgi:hypothetical protein
LQKSLIETPDDESEKEHNNDYLSVFRAFALVARAVHRSLQHLTAVA